ncbi:MAG: hypothetical protein H8E40_15685 [Chloroflexi bacterium]|nr:hypothetical protein [Chloroflexota bacterium]
MQWELIVALVLAIPVILLPAALIWYMSVSGLYQVMREARQRGKRRAAQNKAATVAKVA